MVDDDLFDDENGADFDPFSGMDDDKPASKKGGSGGGGGGSSSYDGGGGSSDGTRSLADFSADVDRRIAVLRSMKQKNAARIAAAQWLGESGDTRAIKALVQVYTSKKTSRGVRGAAKQALGKFKALDVAIDRAEGEEVEVALGRDENTWVLELLQDLAYNERTPRRRGRGLLLMNGVLAILLAILFVIFQAAPTDAVSLTEITKRLGIGATGIPPTPVPTATIALDGLGNPLPTAVPPTPTITPSPTPAPTETPVSAENIRSQLASMYALLGKMAEQRGVLDQLDINWESIAADPTSGSRLCNAFPPPVPEDITLAAGFYEAYPSLGFANDAINGALERLRQAWTDWVEGCAAGDLPNRLGQGQQDILVIRDAFTTAQNFLDTVPRQ